MSLFEGFFIFKVSESSDGTAVGTKLLYKYPSPDGDTGNDVFGKANMKVDDIGSFCFPHLPSLRKVKRMKACRFTFALTIEGGNRLYCFVKRVLPAGPGRRFDVGKRWPIALCFVSKYQFHDMFPQLLDIVHVRQYIDPDSIKALLDAIRNENNFAPGEVIRVRTPVCRVLCDYKITCPRSLDQGNPLLLFKYLTPRILHYLVGAVMTERRVLFIGMNETQVSEAMFGLTALLFPFEWQHIFIPMLPDHLLEYTAAPAPYLVGALQSQLPKIRSYPLGDVVIMDLTKNQLSVNPGGDEVIPYGLQLAPIDDSTLDQEKLSFSFHQEIVNVSNKYRKLAGKHSELIELEASFKCTWLSFALLIFGSLPKFLQREFGIVSSSVEKFIAATLDPDIRKFLQTFQHSQMFQVFVHQAFAEAPPPQLALYNQLVSYVRPNSAFGQVKSVVSSSIKPRNCVPLPAAERYLTSVTAATGDGPAPSAVKFGDVARRSYDLLQSAGFAVALHARLCDTSGRHWRYTLRTMQLLRFLLSAGCEVLVALCLDDVENLHRLTNFRTSALGVSGTAVKSVRSAAAQVHGLLNDFARLLGVRSPGGHVLLHKTLQRKTAASVPAVAALAGVDPGATTVTFAALNTALEPWINLPATRQVDLLDMDNEAPLLETPLMAPPVPPRAPDQRLTPTCDTVGPPPPVPARPAPIAIAQANLQRQRSAPQSMPSRLLAMRMPSKSPSAGMVALSQDALAAHTPPLVPVRLPASTTAAAASQAANTAREEDGGVFNFDNVALPEVSKRQSLPADFRRHALDGEPSRRPLSPPPTRDAPPGVSRQRAPRAAHSDQWGQHASSADNAAQNPRQSSVGLRAENVNSHSLAVETSACLGPGQQSPMFTQGELPSMYGQNPAQQSSMHRLNQASPVFGQTQQPSVYGQNQASPVYGQNQASPVYGQNQASPVYGKKQASPVYGQNQASPVYGQNQAAPVYGQNQASPVYGQNQASPMYGQIQSSPIYGQGQQNQISTAYPPNQPSPMYLQSMTQHQGQANTFAVYNQHETQFNQLGNKSPVTTNPPNLMNNNNQIQSNGMNRNGNTNNSSLGTQIPARSGQISSGGVNVHHSEKSSNDEQPAKTAQKNTNIKFDPFA